MVYIRGGDYATKYTIEIKQTGFNSNAYATVAELVTAPSDITSYDKGEANIATDSIAKALLDGTSFGNTTYDITASAGTVAKTRIKLEEKFGAGNLFTKLSATVSGSVIHIQCSDSTDFDIKVTDSRSNGFAKAFKDATQKFAELPGAGPEDAKDTIIKITGDNSKFADDFYVKLTDEAKGIYEETVGTGIQNSLDASTLPLQIIKETDGTFSVKQAGWKSRGAGDDTSNPFPSFVGSTISDIFFHQNRLGVLSEESVIFTEAGEFLNWFRPTVLNLLDTDPIDVTVSTNRVSILKHALPFSESLLIFSDQTQFILNSAEFLSPLDISLNVTTEFEADLGTTPVGAGRYVFFASPGGAFSTIREFYLQTDTEVKDATDITGHVPRYIVGNIKQMSASSNYNMLCLITDDSPSSKTMWVYGYYWNGQNKVQSSWSKWILDADILATTFVQDEIFLVVQRGTKVYLEKIKLSQDEAVGTTTNKHEILLDRRVKATSASHISNFTSTYYADGSNLKYIDKKGDPLTSAEALAKVSGSEPIYIGQAFDFKFQFSEIIIGQGQKPQTISRLQLRNMNINFAHTGNFTAKVTHTNRLTEDTDEKKFTGRRVSESSNKTGQTSIIESGSFKIPLLGNSKNIRLELLSSSHLPCEFQSAEWEGFYHIRSKRLN